MVIARSAVFLLWEQAGFDADQAIFGLMAKHIAEGRAFPMFIYGDRYLMAVQAWLAAPLFLLFGPSVAALKIPVVLINCATAALLMWVLHRDARLHPAWALLASLFFVLAPPGMAASLVETGGGNPEPFFYVLLLWVLRDRPLWFGVVFAFGFIHRQFTIYGVTAIVAIAWLADRKMNVARLRGVALATIGYLLVAQVVRTAYVFSTPFGPGTAVATVFAGNEGFGPAAQRLCVAPASAIVPAITELFSRFYGHVFGAINTPLSVYGVRSLLRALPDGVPPFWPVLGAIFLAALVRVAWLSIATRQPLWTGRAAVGSFLVLVGLQAGVVYSLTRCGSLDPVTLRYALLMLYLGVGVMTLYFIYETRPVPRRAMAGAMLVWAAVSAASHVRLFLDYRTDPPVGPHRQLANYLVGRGITAGRADYWVAYATTFFAEEQVRLASTTVVRIDEYQRVAAAAGKAAVIIEREPCANGGGDEVVAGTFWVCSQ